MGKSPVSEEQVIKSMNEIVQARLKEQGSGPSTSNGRTHAQIDADVEKLKEQLVRAKTDNRTEDIKNIESKLRERESERERLAEAPVERSVDHITYDEFASWYQHSYFITKKSV